MKKLFTLVLSAVIFQAEAQTPYPSGVINCIARYDFSSDQSTITNLQDVSGNNNNASEVHDLVSVAGWRNKPNKAMLFNGTSSFAMIPHSSNLSPQAVTMVALVKLNGFYNGDCQFSQILCKGYPGYIPGQYSMALGDDVYDQDCHNFDPVHQQLTGYFNNSYTTPGMLPNPGNYVTTGQWYFFAISFNGTSLTYYQVPMETTMHYNNISPIYSASNISNSIGSNTQDISIGKHTNPIFPYWFNGVMDEVVLFNKMLDPKEMQSVYDYLWNDGSTATADIKNNAADILVYPNPNTGSFTVTGNTTANNNEVSYQVRNALGQVVYSGMLTAKNGFIKQVITLPKDITPGTYLLSLNDGNVSVAKKITILK